MVLPLVLYVLTRRRGANAAHTQMRRPYMKSMVLEALESFKTSVCLSLCLVV